MKWVRRNSLQKPAFSQRFNPETRRYEMDPDAKPYRMYSKWHVLHEGRSDKGMAQSLCGQFRTQMSNAEVVETEPTSGTRSYSTQKVTCYYCRIVAESNS